MRMAIKKKSGKDMEKLEPYTLLYNGNTKWKYKLGLYNHVALVEKHMVVPQKIKQLLYDPANSTSGYIPERIERGTPTKDTCTPVFEASLFTIA